MAAHGTLNTARAVKRDRYPDRETDTRRVRAVDVDAWAADVEAESADLWADVAAAIIDPAGFDRYDRGTVGR